MPIPGDEGGQGASRVPGARSLLTLFGADHMLGGIHAYNATDERPERVALIRRACWAYLRGALGIDDIAWKQIQTELAEPADPIGRIDNK